jgi:hypothetical protein
MNSACELKEVIAAVASIKQSIASLFPVMEVISAGL